MVPFVSYIFISSLCDNVDMNTGKIEDQEDETFKCIDCLSGVAPACFICNEREGDRIRCIVPACGKHYHSKCLNSWPQVSLAYLFYLKSSIDIIVRINKCLSYSRIGKVDV